MRKVQARWCAFLAVIGIFLSLGVPARAVDCEPPPSLNFIFCNVPSFAVTLTGPTSVTPATPVTYTGVVTFGGNPTPFEAVEILSNSTVLATTTTDSSGTYSLPLTFASMGIYPLKAVVRRSTPLQAASPVLGVVADGAVRIAAGNRHTCAVFFAGSVRCWGINVYGQIGDGTTGSPRTMPTPVGGITSAIAVATGDYHTCALLAGGSVKCWGNNEVGQLGNGSTTSSVIPVTVSGVGNAIAIAAGQYHTCVVLSSGAVKCWGYNGLGNLGDGTFEPVRSTPVGSVGISTAVTISGGYHHSCATLSSGELSCWGYNSNGQTGGGGAVPATVQGVTGATSVGTGFYHSCVSASTGGATCFGANYYGAIGDGTTTPRYSPTPATGVATASAISGGGFHTCARLSDATARCWGYNYAGQIGDGSTANRLTAAAVSGLSGVAAVATGHSHSCAALTSGRVKCWGNNDFGQVGDGTLTNRLIPTQTI